MPHHDARDTQDPVLTTAAAARMLGVAISTAQLWLESGALPSWKTPGGHRRVRQSAVQRLLDEQVASRRADGDDRPQNAAEFVPVPGPHPLPPNEAARLAAVRASRLLDSETEAVFDRLTWLATQLTDCPIALVSILSAERQWFKARTGTGLAQTPREWAFCSHAIMENGTFMVEDAQQDPRFAANPLVTGDTRVRFYGGVPLRDAAGMALGTLCVLDHEPRRLRDREVKALEELAAIATEELRRRT